MTQHAGRGVGTLCLGDRCVSLPARCHRSDHPHQTWPQSKTVLAPVVLVSRRTPYPPKSDTRSLAFGSGRKGVRGIPRDRLLTRFMGDPNALAKALPCLSFHICNVDPQTLSKEGLYVVEM